MERLTIRNSDGSVSQPTDLKWAEALERLAAYEDTGLEPEEVRSVARGEWIETGYFDQDYQPIYECSHCHREVADNFMAKHLFCLHCGADMRPIPPKEESE